MSSSANSNQADTREAILSSPSLQEIRRLGQKPNYRTQGNLLARYWARPCAIYGTWVAVRLGVSAHFITALAAIAWLGEAVCISTGRPGWFAIGVFLGFLGFWLDHVDGQVARVTNTQSIDGIFIDFWMHTAHSLVRGFGLGWGLYQATGNNLAILGGMSAAFGWTMLGHANDARYKAFFARLKSSHHVFTTHRPIHDRRDQLPLKKKDCSLSIRKLISWPLAKLQEPHVVLFIETLIWISFYLGLKPHYLAWATCLSFWGVTAPMLAIARLARLVMKGQISSEFHEWFQMVDHSIENKPDC